jgi:hypothetical protein
VKGVKIGCQKKRKLYNEVHKRAEEKDCTKHNKADGNRKCESGVRDAVIEICFFKLLADQM